MRIGRTDRPSTWRWLGVVLALSLVGGGCGVSTGDDTFAVIAPEDDPFGLEATSTTTTSTTTTTTTLPVTPDTLPSTTTAIRTETAEVYFLTRRGRLQSELYELPPPLAAEQVADVLEAGPRSDLPLDSLIEEGLIVSFSEDRAVLTVDLDADTFARIPSTQQTEAIGQIVTTMISSLRRVGFVNFTIGGEPISVKKGNSLLSEVGEPLAYDDYSNLLASPPPEIAATTTTTSSTDSTVDSPVDTTIADQ